MRMNLFLCLVFSVVLFANPDCGAKADKGLHPDELAYMVINKQSDFILVDLRSPDEFQYGHIPGAINKTADQLHLNDSLAPVNTRKKIILYGGQPRLRHSISQIFSQRGFKVTYLRGGWDLWSECFISLPDPGANVTLEQEKIYRFRLSVKDFLRSLSGSGGSDDASAPATKKRRRRRSSEDEGC